MQDVPLLQLVTELAQQLGPAELVAELEELKQTTAVATPQPTARRASDGRRRGAVVQREGIEGAELVVRRTINGKRERFYGSTQADIDEKIERFKNGDASAAGKNQKQPRDTRKPRVHPRTLNEGRDRLLAAYPHLDQSGDTFKYNLDRLLKRRLPDEDGGATIGELSPSELGHDELQCALNDLAANGHPRSTEEEPRGLARNTVEGTLKALRQLCSHGENHWEWLNPTHDLVIPKQGLSKASTKDVRPFQSWEEVFALESAFLYLEQRDLARWVLWSCGTGERLQESIVKRECDLIRGEGAVRVHRSLRAGIEAEVTKYDSAAVYYATEVALGVMNEIPPDVRRDPLNWQESPLLFPWHDGGLIDITALRRSGAGNKLEGLWRQALKHAGLEYRPPKHMRHTFAYLALTGGGENGNPALRWPIEDVSSQLRHDHISTTEDYYLDLVPQVLRRTPDQMSLGARPFLLMRQAS